MIQVSNIIAHLIQIGRAGAETISRVATRVVQISRNLKVLLASRLSVVTTQAVEGLPQFAMTAERVATSGPRTVAANARKGPPMMVGSKQFGTKIGRHAGDFGLNAKIAGDREKMAQIVTRIREQPDEVRQGAWHPHSGSSQLRV
jgi:hypothetical protein